jgi:hypothetical protein
MKFNKDLVQYQHEDVYYDGIKLKITRQNIQDYVLQTSMNPESIILFYYKKEISQLRDKQLEQLLNDGEKQDKVD